jgi:hypothetical protein
MNGSSHASSAGPSAASVPPHLQQGIEAVRARLRDASDFAELFQCFDERIARSPELWSSSRVRHDDLLVAIVASIAARLRPGFQLVRCSLYEVGDTGFWHGALMGTNAMACLFYDEQVGIGLVTLSNPFDGSGQTDFVRLTKVTRPRAGAEGCPPGRSRGFIAPRSVTHGARSQDQDLRAGRSRRAGIGAGVVARSREHGWRRARGRRRGRR